VKSGSPRLTSFWRSETTAHGFELIFRTFILVESHYNMEATLMTAVISTLIDLDDTGIAWILGTRIKVIEVAVDKLAHGSSPEEIHFQYPHLSLAQVHAALAYYYEHQSELDAEIQRRWQLVNDMAASENESPLKRRLRELSR
jgi:uncharacterized protein (DUF433 family)